MTSQERGMGGVTSPDHWSNRRQMALELAVNGTVRSVIHRLIYPFLSFFHFFSSFFFVFKDSNQNIQKIKMNQIKFVLVFVWEAGVTSSPILDEGQGVFSSLSSGK